VINESTRRRFFGAGPALGRELVLDGQTLRVQGVVRDVPIVRVAPFSDVWVPLSLKRGPGWREELGGDFMGIFLAHSAAEVPALQAEFKARLARAEMPDRRFTQVHAVPESSLDAWARTFFDGSPEQEASGGRLLALLGGLALAFMLLPAINLANLNAGRALERVSEIGLRKAFGASRLALVLQFVLENVVLCLLGGVLALGLAAAGLRALEAAELVPYAHFALSLRTLGLGLLFTLVFGVLSGAYPAWRLARLHPAEALRGGTR
jgi:putative ABC transport system permease protein